MDTSQKAYITAGQVFSVFFVSRVVIMVTLNSHLLGGGNMMDNLVSTVIAFLLNFLLVLPAFLLHHRRPTLSALDYSSYLLGKGGIIIIVLYLLYLLLINSYYMSFFQLFISNVMDPKTPLWLVAGAVLVVAIYGAFKGIEAIARASGFILVIVLAGLIFIIVTLFPQISSVRYEPILYDGPQQIISGVAVAVGRSTCIVSMSLIFPQVKGNKKLYFTLWNAGVYLLLMALIFVMVGSMGDFIGNQLFPVYTASAIAQAGAFQRFDAIFLAVWMTGLFMKTAMDLYLISQCIQKIAGEKAAKVGMIVAAAVIMTGSLFVTGSVQIQKVFYDPAFLLAATLFMTIAVPVFLLLLDVFKSMKMKKKGVGT